jgi:uncharacterized protein
MSLARILTDRDVVVPAEDTVQWWKNQQYQCGTDCACESGIAGNRLSLSNSDSRQPQITETSFKVVPDLYTASIDNEHLVAYNPHGQAGVAVLDTGATRLLSFMQTRSATTLTDLQDAGLGKTANLTSSLAKFEQAEIIHETATNSNPLVTPGKNIAVWLHVTNQCNLRCTYCYIEKTNRQMSPEMGREALDQIFATAIRHNRSEITLKFAGGEALTVFPLVQHLTAYSRELGKKYDIAVKPILLTNGVSLTPEIAASLKADDFVVALSLDGLGEYNDVTRPLVGGQGSFARIERGLNLLLEYQVMFNVSVVVSRFNLTNLPALTRYLLERRLAFTFNFFRENELADAGLTVENDHLMFWLSQAYKVIGEILPAYSLMNAILDRVQFGQPHIQACGVGTNYIVVKHTGEILGCQMHMQKAGLGTLKQKRDLLQLIQHAKPTGFAVDTKEGCSTCQWKHVCAGGCPVMTFAATGRFDTRSPFCNSYQALIPQVLDLEARRILKYAKA